MARRMLIDASHPEETRVVVVDGTRLEEFDFETSSRKALKGNIYLAKVIRIEPSLQAAFVEYGGNRHGFLAFSEIHPDYYQIPIADRERLIAEQHRLAAEDDEDREREPRRRRSRADRTDIDDARAAARGEQPSSDDVPADQSSEAIAADVPADDSEAHANVAASSGADASFADHAAPTDPMVTFEPPGHATPEAQPAVIERDQLAGPALTEASDATMAVVEAAETAPAAIEIPEALSETPLDITSSGEPTAEGIVPAELAPASTDPADAPQPEISVETLGGDDTDTGEERERRERRRRYPSVRQYKIQEVIKRRQILLVQVVKEERGNKGAALTTYLSLAGRYCVLMPNAGRGGGISRKISNPSDRKRMKEMLAKLDVPQGMGVILRTAGLERSNIDIKRDYEYLSRLWDSIRDITMRSTAPAMIYEEGDLIKRSLRDVYDTDIAQVLVEGEAGFEAASGFMRQLVPHQADKVQRYDEPIPLFHRYQVENQFDAMHSPTVQLRSGGYIVINPTEALVAIDVNSGRATKERNIEETALRTNVEAAEEIARQVRLRDLAGLIVVDFIDMEENRHQRQVEYKMKDAMRTDRARIQIGRISAFGLLEMSRQRLRPSLLEHSTEICPHCAGTGRVRSVESAALHALRAIEEEGVRRRASEIVVSLPPNVALYLLNHKRHTLTDIEKRYGFTVAIEADEELHAADCEIERVRQRRGGGDDRPMPETARASYDNEGGEAPAGDDEVQGPGDEEPREHADGESRGGGDRGEDGDGRRRRRRRRRRGGRRDDEGQFEGDDRPQQHAEGGEPQGEPRGEPRGHAAGDEQSPPNDSGEGGEPMEGGAPGEDRGERGDGGRRRRGRRGGRRRRRDGNGEDGGYQRRDDHGDAPHGDTEHGDAQHSDGSSGDAQQGQAMAPADHMPVSDMPEGRMPVERAPYDAAPPVHVEAAPPPPPPPPVMAPEPPVVAAAPQPVPEPPPPPPPAPAVPVIEAPPEKPKRGWWRR
jgi:ribonuclease E